MYPGGTVEDFGSWITRNKDVIENETHEKCDCCNGKKVVRNDDDEVKCANCHGKGYIVTANDAESIYWKCYCLYMDRATTNHKDPLQLGLTG